jgi:hypothetical protein
VFRTDGQSDQYRTFATIWRVPDNLLHVFFNINDQMIRYSRACGSYQDFLDRGFQLTRKLLKPGFLLLKLKSSLRKLASAYSF